MDSLQMKKIQAMNKYRKQRLLNKLMLYSFTALSCSLFLSSPLWYPILRSFVKVFLFDSIPKVGALVFSPKCIFIVGNLIVIVLVGESKIFKSRSSSLASNVKLNSTKEQENEEKDQKNFIFIAGESKIFRSSHYSLPFNGREVNHEVKEEEFYGYGDKEEDQKIRENCTRYCGENEKDQKEEKYKGDYQEFKFAAEPNELSKRADDFIARVNKQIRLEAVTIV
ncbi:PREDICTED: uncharacterized protein LOC109208520 [Nicotiana attenuata]|uniref:DUF4408 domain-containing protein n=1 Tax=Nicotiana attenuata TaxID=49451 RepID=A0A314KQN6_NICAT|nr:PREDICTED: uncharacterized protein LOC109208520 [Nicotiana attenuata]OIT31572.1 hypothetical protein A4A49_18635 [Nicotiana attenuata]